MNDQANMGTKTGSSKPQATRILAILVLAAVVLAGAAYAFTTLPSLLDQDGRAPDFTIQTVNGPPFTLSEHRGEVVVIDLMAVDCPSCRITEKSVLALNASRPNVTIVSIDIWVHLEDEAKLQKHMDSLNATWPYGMDTADLLTKYNAFEISKVVVVDAAGFMTWSKVGGIGAEELLEAVDAAIAGTDDRARTIEVGLVGFAAIAGVASFFAPCAFPLLPGYMAYTVSLGERKPSRTASTTGTTATANAGAPSRLPMRRALVPGLVAASGILIVYGIIGVIVALAGEAASPYLPLLQPFVGVAAIILGIVLLAGVSMDRIVEPLQRLVDRIIHRGRTGAPTGDLAGFFSYGLGYGAAAAGCTAPVFLQVSLSALAFGLVTGLQVFAAYAGMAAALMVLATLVSMNARGFIQRYATSIVRYVNPVVGGIMVLAGVYLVWFYWQAFGAFLPG